MKIILTENISTLGEIGEVVDVADGYGRNYLLPKKKAVRATEGNLAQVEHIKRLKASKESKLQETMEKFAEKLDGLSCDIVVEVDENEDKIFGTVTTKMIAETLSEQHNIDIDKDKIIIEEPIKKLGIYLVPVNLHPDVRPKIKVWVVRS